MRENSADLLFRMDRDAEAADRFGEAAEDLRAADDPLGEVRTLRRRVEALRWANQPEQAIETVAQARELHEALPDEPAAVWEAAMLDNETAVILARQDDYAGALERLTGVPDRLRGIGADDSADEADLFTGRLLMRLDRAAEAEARARRMREHPDEDDEIHDRVTGLLHEAQADQKTDD